jgi:hypothetical protein|tara:strand:+ start:3636 stop:4682 length:1047 start_codon:yes stop_codon:yes gene_type:complete
MTISEIVERERIPVLPKQIPSATTKDGRKKTTFPKKVIRVRENSKTDWNLIDSVKGCKGGCHGCYAADSMHVTYAKIKFDKPIVQILEPNLLFQDGIRVIKKGRFWVRNGVLGDPSYCWETTVRCAEALATLGIRSVIITKMWKTPTEEQLWRLAMSDAVFHWSVIAGYDFPPWMDNPDGRIDKLIETFYSYDALFPKKHHTYLKGQDNVVRKDRVFLRICTIPYNDGCWEGELLNEAQDGFVDIAEQNGWRRIETPWRMSKNHPAFDYCDSDNMKNPTSYHADRTNGYANAKKNRQKLMGTRYFDGDKFIDSDTPTIGCLTSCDECPNQCGTLSEATKPGLFFSYAS